MTLAMYTYRADLMFKLLMDCSYNLLILAGVVAVSLQSFNNRRDTDEVKSYFPANIREIAFFEKSSNIFY